MKNKIDTFQSNETVGSLIWWETLQLCLYGTVTSSLCEVWKAWFG